MSGIVLTDKDKIILEFLYKFRVATYDELAVLLNAQKTTVYNRLNKLTKYNFIKANKIIFAKQIYYLSEQGHHVLASNGKVVDPLKMNLLHEVFLSKVGVVLLRDNEDLELNDIYTERDLLDKEEDFFKVSNKVFPDLYIPKYKVIIEYERTKKRKKRIENKIMKNFQEFSDCKQIWILPRTRKTTIDLLKANSFYVGAIVVEEYVERSLEDTRYTLALNKLLK